MDSSLITGLINYPILYFNHYHQQEIVDRVAGAIRKIFPSLPSEEQIITDDIDADVIEENARVKVIDYNGAKVNKDVLWAQSPVYGDGTNRDLEWMYTCELRDIISDMSKEFIAAAPCVYVFRSVPYSLLLNAEFVAYLHKFISLHERLQSSSRACNCSQLNWTIVLIVPSGEQPPASIEGAVRLISIKPPKNKEINSEINVFFKDSSDADKEELCKSLQGLQLYDIRQILKSTKTIIGDTLSYRSIAWARKEKQQIISKSGVLEEVIPNVKFDDIGGLFTLKKDLRNKSKIFKHLSILQDDQMRCQVPKGILLIGMPGCGKTMIAKAIASEFQLPLLRLDVGKLLGKHYGQSETNLRRALEVAESAHPCVLWIDEIEKAFAGTNNKGDNDDLMMRLMGAFLTWMQERESPVYVVATANDVMKPEFMRKGRFDEVYFVDFPKLEERMEIAQNIAKEYDGTKVSFLPNPGDNASQNSQIWQDLAKAMQVSRDKLKNPEMNVGLTGSEIRALITTAVEKKYIERINDLDKKKQGEWSVGDFVSENFVIDVKKDLLGLVPEFLGSAMVNQSRRLVKHSGQNEGEEMSCIDRIYAIKDQYQFKSAT